MARRKWSRSEAAVPKPQRQATSSTGRSDSSSSRRASSTRWASSHCSGVVPVSSRKRRAKVRGLTAGVAGHRGDVEGLAEALERPAPGRLQRAAGAAAARRLKNWAWPPSRWGARDHVAGDPLAGGGAEVVADRRAG